MVGDMVTRTFTSQLLYPTPPMNVLGSGTEPLKLAPEKSKPGFCNHRARDPPQ